VVEFGVAGEPALGEVFEGVLEVLGVGVGGVFGVIGSGWCPGDVAAGDAPGPGVGVDVSVVASAEQGAVGFAGRSVGVADQVVGV
jgi:hypothetical protein